MNKVYYMNSNNVIIDLRGKNYTLMNDSDISDYSWTYSRRDNVIYSFARELKEKKAKIYIKQNKEKTCAELINELYETLEQDVVSKTPGRLYVGEYYLKCYFMACNMDNERTTAEHTIKEFTVVPVEKAWIKEGKEIEFVPSKREETGYDYPYEFPFDYGTENGNASEIVNDNYTTSNAIIKIYGYAKNPEIEIGNNIYKLNYTIKENEICVIDTKKRKIKLYSGGTVKNLFSYKSKDFYIFEKIESGKNHVYWNGDYKFSVLLMHERSEPIWE